MLLLSVPLGEVTVTEPVVAPGGTTAVRYVSDLIVKVAGVPLNETAAVPVKPWPRMPTVYPTRPVLIRNSTKGASPRSRLKIVPP